MSAMPSGPMTVERTSLEGRHVRLEPLTQAHHEALAAALDPTLLQWFPVPATNPAELAEFIDAALAAERAGTARPFAIVERESGRAVGSTRYMAIEREHRRLEIGSTWIARRWQRSAVNTESKLLLLGHAFEGLGAIRVEFKTDSLNVQSREALHRLGAREEGFFRNHMITASGRIRHSVYFAIAREDWPEVRGRLERRLARATETEGR